MFFDSLSFGYFGQVFGSRVRAWEDRGDVLGRVSEKEKCFQALLAALWHPYGGFGRPLIPFSVPLGSNWMIFFIVFL